MPEQHLVISRPKPRAALPAKEEQTGLFCYPCYLRKKVLVIWTFRHGFNPWVGKIPWRGEWHPTPIFLPDSMDRGASAWSCKESEMTEHAQAWAAKDTVCIVS